MVTKCPNCKKLYPDDLPACPHCGAKAAKKSPSQPPDEEGDWAAVEVAEEAPEGAGDEMNVNWDALEESSEEAKPASKRPSREKPAEEETVQMAEELGEDDAVELSPAPRGEADSDVVDLLSSVEGPPTREESPAITEEWLEEAEEAAPHQADQMEDMVEMAEEVPASPEPPGKKTQLAESGAPKTMLASSQELEAAAEQPPEKTSPKTTQLATPSSPKTMLAPPGEEPLEVDETSEAVDAYEPAEEAVEMDDDMVRVDEDSAAHEAAAEEEAAEEAAVAQIREREEEEPAVAEEEEAPAAVAKPKERRPARQSSRQAWMAGGLIGLVLGVAASGGLWMAGYEPPGDWRMGGVAKTTPETSSTSPPSTNPFAAYLNQNKPPAAAAPAAAPMEAAQQAWENGNFQQAAKSLEQVQGTQKENPEYHVALGKSLWFQYMATKHDPSQFNPNDPDVQKARKEFLAANNPDGYFGLAQMDEILGRVDPSKIEEARKVFQDGMQKFPDQKERFQAGLDSLDALYGGTPSEASTGTQSRAPEPVDLLFPNLALAVTVLQAEPPAGGAAPTSRGTPAPAAPPTPAGPAPNPGGATAPQGSPMPAGGTAPTSGGTTASSPPPMPAGSAPPAGGTPPAQGQPMPAGGSAPTSGGTTASQSPPTPASGTSPAPAPAAGAAPAPGNPATEEAGFEFWRAMKLAAQHNYAEAIRALDAAEKIHQQRRFLHLGKPQNPNSDPTEEIFLRSADQLRAYWQMQQQLQPLQQQLQQSGYLTQGGTLPDALAKLLKDKQNASDTLTAIANQLKTNKEVAAADPDLTNLPGDVQMVLKAKATVQNPAPSSGQNPGQNLVKQMTAALTDAKYLTPDQKDPVAALQNLVKDDQTANAALADTRKLLQPDYVTDENASVPAGVQKLLAARNDAETKLKDAGVQLKANETTLKD
ncbi:MAG: hypothetical protein JO112_20555, partial [Planctomycetes bacterium]|nr:hypothetical protein [Planctomycetota bacterium]